MIYTNLESRIEELFQSNFSFPVHNVFAEFLGEEQGELEYNISWEWSRHVVEFSSMNIVLRERDVDIEMNEEEDVDTAILNAISETFANM